MGGCDEECHIYSGGIRASSFPCCSLTDLVSGGRPTQFDVHWKRLILDKAEATKIRRLLSSLEFTNSCVVCLVLLPSPPFRLSSLLEFCLLRALHVASCNGCIRNH